MSTKSGQGSQDETETGVNSPEPLLGEFFKPSLKNSAINLSSLSPVKSGDIRKVKSLVVDGLVNVAEQDGSSISIQGRQVLTNFIDATSKGYAGSLGMICKGTSCSFISHCPLHEIKAPLPEGKKCPVENSMLTVWINKHLKTLGIEDPNDPIHSFDMDMLYELAGQELIRWRCSVHLSDDAALVSNQQVGATQQGDPIFADVINPVLDVMERSGRNISKIRDALVATREAQIKAGQLASDPTERAANLREKAHNMIQKRREANEKIKEAEFEVRNKDELI